MKDSGEVEANETTAKRGKFVSSNSAENKSLDEINGSIEVPEGAGFWRTLMTYTGPGILIAVGYMDPGNWITSIAGGAQYKYTLLSVVLISSLIAMLLQVNGCKTWYCYRERFGTINQRKNL